jgi:hypothetical protein
MNSSITDRKKGFSGWGAGEGEFAPVSVDAGLRAPMRIGQRNAASGRA